ncbi:MAG TPA: aldose epimerase family protein [Saprospiraceae bacterium]|nr:aldose epimerase family protein [Saprospiraceae bacterium]
MEIQVKPFGQYMSQPVQLFILDNGISTLKITNFGGIITSWIMVDGKGMQCDVVLGFEHLNDYLKEHPYFGAIIGRYANRIANAEFHLDGNTYALYANNGPNSLHGGLLGFSHFLWTAEAYKDTHRVGVKLKRMSPHLEEGYPGNLDTQVTYSLNTENELIIEYIATTDRATVCNLTNHSYFNLNGAGQGNILDHFLQIAASHITPVNDHLIPTGKLMPVSGSPFDFKSPKRIGEDIHHHHPQMVLGNGYDHNFVLDEYNGELQWCARVYSQANELMLDVQTTEPGIQLYTANWLDGSIAGKGGFLYQKHGAFCLETQHFPDSPNQKVFPSVVLRPGNTFKSVTTYKLHIQ